MTFISAMLGLNRVPRFQQIQQITQPRTCRCSRLPIMIGLANSIETTFSEGVCRHAALEIIIADFQKEKPKKNLANPQRPRLTAPCHLNRGAKALVSVSFTPDGHYPAPNPGRILNLLQWRKGDIPELD